MAEDKEQKTPPAKSAGTQQAQVTDDKDAVPEMAQKPTGNLVLASNVVDLDDDGNQVVVGKEGEALPSELSDYEDAYVENGVLVPESYKAVMDDPRMKAALSGSMGLHDVVQLSKDQMEQLKEVAAVTPAPPVVTP